MGTTFHDVTEYLTKCCDGFLSKDYSVTMVSNFIMDMDLWNTDTPFVQGMRSLNVFEFSEDEQLSLLLMCVHILEDGLTPIDYGGYHRHPCPLLPVVTW